MKTSLLALVLCFGAASTQAQELPHYTGTTLSNPDYHHGQLSPAMGVHNIQTFRANREHPELAENMGWTYNHAPMLAYWNNTFFLEYLNDPVGEHLPPGTTLIQKSADGYQWTKPEVIFPAYKIPDGFSKEGDTAVARNVESINHQRMGFYVSKDNRLLVLAYIAISLHAKDSPNDGNGIGRVVREMKADGSYGPIYFLRYNHGWNEKNTTLPFYKKSKDKGFVKACDELLSTRLITQQWNEEADRDDPLISLKGDYKAFNFYHLPDGNVVGLWKHALSAISSDEGQTWTQPTRSPGFVNNNAKIWGQRTSDGRYATVYNPADFRWPLAISTSSDGLNYTNLLLVNGEISPMRYGGNYKSYGPQYVRGIVEGNGVPADGNLWVTYSMNKEDIWVSRIPVPVTEKETKDVNEIFEQMEAGSELNRWNIFSPLWAPVTIEKDASGVRNLTIADADECDYAKAERLFPRSENVAVEFKLKADQADHGQLDIELMDEKGMAALRLSFNAEGQFQQKNGYRMKNILAYESGKTYDIRIELTCGNRFFYVYVDGQKKSTGMCFAPVQAVERICFRTGDVRRFPDVDTPTDQDWDRKQNGLPLQAASWSIYSLTTKAL